MAREGVLRAMLGVLVYRLRAETGARLSPFHGRLMHAAAFSLLEAYSEELAALVHDQLNLKPFTVSLLRREESGWPGKFNGTSLTVKPGEHFLWRVTAYQAEILEAFTTLPPGTRLLIGRGEFSVLETIVDGRLSTGIATAEDLLEGVSLVDSVRSLTLAFRSPVSFRNYDRDYPFPLPELVFGSLADKWLAARLPGDFGREQVKTLAQELSLASWQGRSRSVYLSKDRGVRAFWGKFCYDTSVLSTEGQRICLMLAQFAEFAGVGRLTAQGFGETAIDFEGEV